MFRQEERCNEKNRPLHRGIFQKCTAHRYSEMIDEYGSEDAVLTLTDGTKYVGTLSNGKFNGDCIINYANGDKYEGKVADNLKSGNGTYTWDDNASYVGNWSNDMSKKIVQLNEEVIKRIAAARKLKKITAQQLCDKLEQYGMWYGIIKVFQLRNCTF